MKDLKIKPVFRYRLTSTGDNSAKYGKCEVCGKDCSEVFIQTEEMQYISPIDNKIHWTTAKCFQFFGCKQCLISKQR